MYVSLVAISVSGYDTNVPKCEILVSESKIQSRYCNHLRTNIPDKGMDPIIHPVMA